MTLSGLANAVGSEILAQARRVAGDKAGVGQRRLYQRLIGRADERYDAHLLRLIPTLDEVIAGLPPADRGAMIVRAAELIAEEHSLAELRRALKRTRVHISTVQFVPAKPASSARRRRRLARG